jgi:hypothetical protein
VQDGIVLFDLFTLSFPIIEKYFLMVTLKNLSVIPNPDGNGISKLEKTNEVSFLSLMGIGLQDYC